MNRNLTLHLERRFPHSPERLFQAWTDPTALRKWFAPPGCVTESISVELTVGGSFRFRLRHSSGHRFSIWGEFREIVPARRLVSSWFIEQPNRDPCKTRLRVSFDAVGTGTLVRLTQELLPDEAALQSQKEALECCLQRLTLFLDGKPLRLAADASPV